MNGNKSATKKNDGGKGKFENNNNCTVRALAIALKLSYEESYELLNYFGREHKRGINFNHYLSKLNKMSGIEILRKIKKRYLQETGMTLGMFCEEYKKGTYILLVYRHATVVIDGV